MNGLAAHASILQDEVSGLQVGFSLPRVKTMDADPAFSPARPVSDEDFVRSMLFLRLAHPSAHLTLTTREAPSIRDLSLALGVSKLSAGVSTAPGGYVSTAGDEETGARAQFDVADERSVDEIAALVSEAGLTPVFD